MIAVTVAVLAVVFALLTWVGGWWMVLAVGVVAGALGRRPALVALGAALGWAALLVVDASHGRLGALATVLGGVFPVPGWGLLFFTLAFAALGAWSAATIAGVVVARFVSPRWPLGRREDGSVFPSD